MRRFDHTTGDVALGAGAATSGLAAFRRDASRFAMLDAEEERALARSWRDAGDFEACRTLVGSHLRLVIAIANGYRGYPGPVEDLVSVGNIGLMEAVNRFDPDRGSRLSGYARWWIHAAIKSEVMRSWSLVRIGTTAAEKKLFFGLRRVKGKLSLLDDNELSADAGRRIARMLGVPESTAREMNRRLAGGDRSLSVSIADDSDTPWQDLLVDPTDSQETVHADREETARRRGLVTEGLHRLDERERLVLTARRLRERPVTLRELGEELGISCERVRQIEIRAFEKLRRAVRNATCRRTGTAAPAADA